jgi:hypothetical protein
MKNKDIVEIILGIIIVVVFSWVFYQVGYLQAEKDSVEWVEDKITKL